MRSWVVGYGLGMSLVWDIICQTYAVLHLIGALAIALAFVAGAVGSWR